MNSTIGLGYKNVFWHIENFVTFFKSDRLHSAFSPQLIGQSSVLPVTKSHSCVKTHSLSFGRCVMLYYKTLKLALNNTKEHQFSINLIFLTFRQIRFDKQQVSKLYDNTKS